MRPEPATIQLVSTMEQPMMKVALLVGLGAVAASCLASAASKLPPLRADRWVNSPPLNADVLRGKVVLVDFWEYTCINWIRTSPFLLEFPVQGCGADAQSLCHFAPIAPGRTQRRRQCSRVLTRRACEFSLAV
jgi:hypothetical protein